MTDLAVKPVRAVWKVPVVVSVAAVVYTKTIAVRLSAQPATEPLAGVGKMGIFANPVETQDKHWAEILAVCATRTEAEHVIRSHREANPDLAAEYQIQDVTVGVPDTQPAVQPPATHPCVDCGVDGLGLTETRCTPCQKKYWASCGWAGEE